MNYGALLVAGETGPTFPDSFLNNAKLAEEHGFDRIGVGDAQNTYRELFTSLGVLAQHTEDIELGSCVTNSVTRHPAVIASGMCTLEETTDGQAFLGIATGNVSVTSLGLEPSRLRELEKDVSAIKALCSGRSVSYDGQAVELEWVAESDRSFDVPVYVAAGGPKTLKLAGKVADGVLIGNGLAPEVIQDGVDRVNESARAAGRDPDDIRTWIMARSAVDESREDATDEVKPWLATAANHSFRHAEDDPHLPEGLEGPVASFREEYQAFGESGERDAIRSLIDEYGLADYFIERFAVAGTPDDCVETLEHIRETGLVDGIFFSLPPATTVPTWIKTMGEDVLPRVP